jgi:PAS domain S-box-containing protein
VHHPEAGLEAITGRRVIRLRALAIGGAALVLLYGACLYFRLGGQRVTVEVDDFGSAAAALVATVLTGRRALRPAARSKRMGWLLLSLTCILLGAGELIYAYYQLVLNNPVPFPSLADVGYLSGACLAVLAVLLLAGSAWAPSRPRLILDGAIVACSLLLLGWLTTLHAVYQAGANTPFEFALSLAYPVADLVTVTIIVSSISHIEALDPALVIVGLGMGSLAVTDSIFVYLANLGTYGPSNVIDVGYVAGYLLLGGASLAGTRPGGAGPHLSRWQTMLPYGPLLIAAVVVMANVLTHHALDLLSQAGLAVVVGLVLGRQFMAVIESQSLTARLNTTVAALREALVRWRDVSDEQETLIEQAPVGICRLDGAGTFLSVNRTLEEMLGYPAERFVGRAFSDFLLPADGTVADGDRVRTGDGHGERSPVEVHGVRSDGAVIWCSAVVAPLERPDGEPERLVGIVEDITDRRMQRDRAAHVQRQLLPQAVPQIDGYELAGACVPAEDVAGDLYDWVAAEGGRLDVTVADVMGKGVGAALVMAVLRTALRSADPALGPAARVRLAADAMGLGMGGEGLFITLFHARLTPDSGLLTYVDAGHGYCAIRRGNGEIAHLGERSLPVGVLDNEVFREGAAQLELGDTLVVYSDGLVEREDRTVALEELAQDLETSANVTEVVSRLMRGMTDRPRDDVTLLALRRIPMPRSDRAAPVCWGALDVAIEFAGSPEQLEDVHGALARFWSQLDTRPSSAWQMLFELAVAEVAANIIEHARPDVVAMRLATDGDQVTAGFRYTGPGWTDPEATVEPGAMAERGRGLFLARTGVDEVAYNRVGTIVHWRLVKRMTERAR